MIKKRPICIRDILCTIEIFVIILIGKEFFGFFF
jgi:hypothetical protein